MVSWIIQLFSSFQLLTAPCKYCSFFVHCHPTRLGGAIAAIDGAIEGGSPPQTIVKRGSVRPPVWKSTAL